MVHKFVIKMGGEGSGNFGHEGRPGERGGSGSGGGVSAGQQGMKMPKGLEDLKDLAAAEINEMRATGELSKEEYNSIKRMNPRKL